MQQHTEPEDIAGEISLPLSLEQMGKQEQQRAALIRAQSRAAKTSSAELCRCKIVELQQG